jgi:exonuclease III
MKIVSWNCNGGLRNKLKEIDTLNADVLVVQECEDPQFYKEYKEWAGRYYIWKGRSKNKGLGIFPKRGARIQTLPWTGQFSISGLSSIHKSISWTTSELKEFIPLTINGALTVLAVWTKGSRDDVFGYIGQLWKYIQIHRAELSGPGTIVIGDFNSNSIWDRKDRWWSHSGVVAELAELGLRSLYHEKRAETQGAELEPTFFLQRDINKPYHIDYSFISSELLACAELTLGRPTDWLSLSDHMPLAVEID